MKWLDHRVNEKVKVTTRREPMSPQNRKLQRRASLVGQALKGSK